MKKLLAVAVCLLVAAPAMADVTLPAFSYITPPVGNLGVAPISQTDISQLLGNTYNSFSVTATWQNQTGFAWSSEANLFFLNGDYDTATVIHQNGTLADNGANSSANINLVWNQQNFAIPYVGGDPLWFMAAQAYGGSTAEWANITITLHTALLGPPPPPPATDLGTYDGINEIKYLGNLGAGEVSWTKVTLAAGDDMTFSTSKSLTAGGMISDTEIGVYDNFGNLLATNDDISYPANPYSLVTLPGLAAGDYYVAVGGYNTTYGATGFNATSTSGLTGGYWLNIYPEPTTLALLAFGAIGLIRRRR